MSTTDKTSTDTTQNPQKDEFASTTEEPGENKVKSPANLFPRLDTFVEQWLVHVYEQKLSTGRAWCPAWWKHDGAVARLLALWMAWENMRTQAGPTGMAVWFVQYGDPIMSELTRGDGVFAGCKDKDSSPDSELHRENRPHPDGSLPTLPVVPTDLFAERA